MTARRMVARMSRMRRRRHRRRRRRRIVLAGGLIALGVHKLSKKDVERVEEQTGKPAEELTDEELEQAMDQQDAAEDDYIAELERLASLRDQGIITDEEFEAKKKQLLDQ